MCKLKIGDRIQLKSVFGIKFIDNIGTIIYIEKHRGKHNSNIIIKFDLDYIKRIQSQYGINYLWDCDGFDIDKHSRYFSVDSIKYIIINDDVIEF